MKRFITKLLVADLKIRVRRVQPLRDPAVPPAGFPEAQAVAQS
jgi:hypothetical protein